MAHNPYKRMSAEFKPKDAETLKQEITAELGVEYEGNEELVDKMVARGLKDEEFKASLHADKKKHLEGKEALKQKMLKAGIDPETGEKLEANATSKSPGMDLKDIRALQDVHDDDVDEVTDFAKFKGISVAEAKKHPVMQSLLKTRAEERASAAAANTGSSKRVSKESGEALLTKVNRGEEMNESEMQEAARLRLQQKKKK